MNPTIRRKTWIIIICTCLFVAGLYVGYLSANNSRQADSYSKFTTVFDYILGDYVDEISPDSLAEMAIPALIKNLDPHSHYIPANDVERTNRDLESTFFGIGVQFQMMNDTVCIVEIVSGGPAERVGVKAGDRIVEVNGKAFTGDSINNEKVQNTLRGAKDTTVSIKVKRSTSEELLPFDIVRGEIPSTSVDASYLIDENIGYIRLSKFAPNTYAEFLQALNSLFSRGATHFILDLRGNSGGLLDQAILISNEFLKPMRTIVEVRGRHSKENANWLADGLGAFTDEPLVVLMDEFSASSSEIVAGAIQDNDRGLVVGRRSFGKGLVQRQITLPDSSQMRLTVQRYYTPSGRSIQKEYKLGKDDKYETEILDRYTNGEVFKIDSTKIDTAKIFHTVGGRTVYGGGGILPDVFVPSDTTDVTSYYLSVANAGLLNRYAFEYADLNRDSLVGAKNVGDLLAKLPPDGVLLQAFTKYAADKGVARRWYYINISSKLIVKQLQALIARDILGMSAYFEIINSTDPTVNEAVKQLRYGVDKTIDKAIKDEQERNSQANQATQE